MKPIYLRIGNKNLILFYLVTTACVAMTVAEENINISIEFVKNIMRTFY